MSQHVRLLAYLNIAMGGLGLLGAVVIMTLMGGLSAFLAWLDPTEWVAGGILALIAALVIGLLLVLSLPFVIAGFGLLNFQPWARILMLILCALNLFNVPFGTMASAYGFWVLLKPETERLFEQRGMPVG